MMRTGKSKLDINQDQHLYPHAPDVLERETSDDGFSAGWGLHHLPSENYILDCHTHMLATTAGGVQKAVDEYYARAGAMRLRRHVALDGKPASVAAFSKVSAKDDRFLWLVWPHHNQPDLKFLKKAAKLHGFTGLKLHNYSVITEGAKPDVWLTREWDEIFEFCAEQGKPVLWHVTQRLTDAPYMGGGRNSYWKDGWPKGVKYGNRELMDVFLDCVKRHTKTRFIAAHHCHIGPEMFGKLFDKYSNLYTDLSCGNIVRIGDDMYEADRQRWRNYAFKYSDRLLFGTDCILAGTAGIWYLWETLAAHIRFVHQLRLDKTTLEKVAHENFEKIAGLTPVELKREDWAAVRP
jgi:predicted TIM-barrel fold metal-dependent hydrolase